MASSDPVSFLSTRPGLVAMAYLGDPAAQNADPRQVQPLRLAKSNSSSPSRMSGSPRPLSEISPSEKRRNSPSTNQAAKVRHAHRRSSRPSALGPH